MSEQMAGFVVWDEKYHLTYRGHVYETEERAERALAGIVWHSRNRYRIRCIYLGLPVPTNEEQ